MCCVNRARLHASAFLLALALAACAGDDAPPPAALAPVSGEWASEDGRVRLTIWEDASVRVRIPSLEVDVLSRLAQGRRGWLVNLGGVWQAPAHIERQGDRLRLLWPSDPPRSWTLARVRAGR